MPAGRTIEPIAAIFALGIRQSLFTLALRALAIHLAASDIIFEQQSTPRTGHGIWLGVGCFAIGCRAAKNHFTLLAPVFTCCFFFTNRTLFHYHTFQKLQPPGQRRKARPTAPLLDSWAETWVSLFHLDGICIQKDLTSRKTSTYYRS